jgi:hypothetical protein
MYTASLIVFASVIVGIHDHYVLAIALTPLMWLITTKVYYSIPKLKVYIFFRMANYVEFDQVFLKNY